jgi:periplasmic copper chaperone A
LRNVRILAGAVLAITLVSLWAPAASAHVTVQPATATQGGRGSFVLRVPNESATASTIKLEVQMPKEFATTFASMRVTDMPGWTVDIEKEALNPPIKGETSDITSYVSKITWTAQEGTKIGPDKFADFPFTTGVLPKDKTVITFKAIQTYDGPLADGTTEARWIQARQEGQPDPPKPEPQVKLTPPTTAITADQATNAQAAGGDLASVKASAEEAASAANSAKTMGILALILGLIALVVAGVAFMSKPKAAPGPASTTETKDPEPVDA